MSSSKKGLEVIIENEETGDVEASFFIRSMSIAASARRYALFEKIKDCKYPDNKANQLVYCANISTVLCNIDGELLYPEPTQVDDKGELLPDNGYLDLYENFDEKIFYLLAEAYAEVNPINGSLKAKKKKY